jgi:hypothetical protein
VAGFRAKEQDAAASLAAIQDVERELAAARQQAGQFDERIRLLRHQLDTSPARRRTPVSAAPPSPPASASPKRPSAPKNGSVSTPTPPGRFDARQACACPPGRHPAQPAAQLAELRQQAGDTAARLAEAEAADLALRDLRASRRRRRSPTPTSPACANASASSTKPHPAWPPPPPVCASPSTTGARSDRRRNGERQASASLSTPPRRAARHRPALAIAPGGPIWPALRRAAAELGDRPGRPAAASRPRSAEAAEARHRPCGSSTAT